MKRLFSFLFGLTALLLCASTLHAQEPYAVLSDDNTVLTFYYDTQKEARGGMSVGPFWDYHSSSWYNQASTITTVVFDNSFANCTSLTSTAHWFENCRKLTTITGIENLKTYNVTNMSCMFYSCDGLTSLNLSGFNTENVTDMSAMFFNCSGLTSLDVSGFKTDNVTDMGGMFSRCTGLTSLDVSGFKTDNVRNMLAMFDICSSLTSLDLSGFKTDNVTNMANMFEGCKSLTSLDLSGFKTDNVTNMGGMFYYCYNLATIYAGNGWSTESVTNGEIMFSGCSNLVGGQGTAFDSNHTDHTYARIDGGETAPGYFTAKATSAEPSELNYAFDDESLTASVIALEGDQKYEGDIVIPETVQHDGRTYQVTSIGDNAFYYSDITSIVIPNSVTSIGTCSFRFCSSLKNLNIPNSVTQIGYNTFEGCGLLSSVFIPASVKEIGYAIFADCMNLEEIKVDINNTVYDSRDNCNAIVRTSDNAFYVGCKNSTIPNSITSISEYAFYNCIELSTIKIPNNVTSIGYCAFHNCRNLTTIIIPTSVTNLSYGIFPYCTNLETIIVEEDNPAYDSRNNCNAIIRKADNTLIAGCKNTIIPITVKSIETNAFVGYVGDNFVIPNNVISIGDWVFQGSLLKSLTLPKDLKYIGEQAFAQCYYLTDLFIYCEDLPTIGGELFNAMNLKPITLHVPVTAFDIYRSTEPWSQFGTIVPIEEENPNITIPTDGHVAYYPFNGNANDESGHGNNGTPMENVTLTTGVHGEANGAYRFGGPDNPGNIRIPNSESLQIGDGWSFAAYVKPLSIGGMWGSGAVEDFGSFCIMGKSHDQHGVSIKYEYPGEESFRVKLGAWGWDEVGATDNNVTHLGEWTHVAVTKSGNNYKVFINGRMMSEIETEHDYSIANGEDLYLGKYDDFWYPMNGVMDEVCIYNRALTSDEVRQMAQYAEDEGKAIPNEAIDLGLPSGTKWAPWNVGASKPEDLGGHYAWGETEEKDYYDWSTYIHCDGTSGTCHDIGRDIAGTDYDVAHVKWGGSWTMPTLDQMKELLDNCSSEWTTVNGINGCKFTSKINGNSIFLPAAGDCWEDWLSRRVDSWGRYWSSTCDEGGPDDANSLIFEPDYTANWYYSGRLHGFSVRPVISKVGNINAEPYAVLSDDNTTLTFFYDNAKAERGGLSVGPFDSWDSPRWDGHAADITTVVFDDSFADCTTLTSTARWFNGCSNLSSIVGIENLKTENVTDMGSMFYECSSLTSLDLSSFNTSNVTDMSWMFSFCTSLTSLDLSNFNTANVTNMFCIFQICSSLTSLDVSNFNTEKVTNMSCMFSGCSNLTSLDLSSFYTANVRNLNGMFQSCSGLTSLDLSNFNTEKVTDMGIMFWFCSELKTIYGKDWDTSRVTSSSSMFTGCTSLVGGKGTVYDDNHIDHTYARIDGGEAAPGYFTAKETDTDTDISSLDNVIYVERTEASAGSDLTLSVKMKNTASIRGFQFDMYLPEGVTVAKNNKGRFIASLSASRLDDGDEHTLTVTQQSDGSYRFLCGSLYEETFLGNDGEIATVKLNIAEDMEDGDYLMYLRKIKLTENDISKKYETAEVKSTLTISSYTIGDINDDGEVDVSDYIGIANHIMGNTPAGFNAKAADVDGDGVIDVSDYIGVANIILTGSIYGSQQQTRISRHGDLID